MSLLDPRGREFLGVGWAFPVHSTTDFGTVEQVAFEGDIKQSILIILETAKGERVMRPDFGCGIHDLVFDVANNRLMEQIKRVVEEALRTYEARIEVESVTVSTEHLFRGRLDVEIDYRVRATNQVGNFVYPYYFRQGT